MKIAKEKRFKRILEAKRQELLWEIEGQRDRLTVECLGDPMDQVRIIADREFVLRSIDRISATLCMVEDALGEMREGTFGLCEQCGMDIPARRLEAVPWSHYCVACQERTERAGNRVEVYKSRYATQAREVEGVARKTSVRRRCLTHRKPRLSFRTFPVSDSGVSVHLQTADDLC